jgi:methylglutaconyl-CoA hydratase
MNFSTLLLETDGRGVATLTLNRPERHNALDGTMISELRQAADLLAADAGVRVVVLTGAGASFCAGGDLDWMRQQMAASRDERMAQARLLAEMLGALNSLHKPLIGKAQGAAYGGGVGLLCVCDVALAVDTARFGLTETKLGLIPATIGPYVLARVGEAMARRVFMSARIFDAAEAMALGIAARVVAPRELDAAVEAEVLPYLAAAPRAVGAAKALVRRLGPRIDAAVIEASVTALADAWETEEAREGVAAFFEKRKPGWTVP